MGYYMSRKFIYQLSTRGTYSNGQPFHATSKDIYTTEKYAYQHRNNWELKLCMKDQISRPLVISLVTIVVELELHE